MPLAHERHLALAHSHSKLAQHEQAMQIYQQLIDSHRWADLRILFSIDIWLRGSADEWQYYTGYLDALMTLVTDVNHPKLTQARDWLVNLQTKHIH